MDKNKSLHYNYTHEAIPVVFHSQSDDFFKFLERDGIQFLKFWWKHVAVNLGMERPDSSEGIGFQIREFTPTIKSVLIHLPDPKMNGEVFLMVCVKLPAKRTFFPTKFTRVYCLEREGLDDEGKALTGLYELTPRARNVRVGDGTPVQSEEFIQAVKRIMKI